MDAALWGFLGAIVGGLLTAGTNYMSLRAESSRIDAARKHEIEVATREDRKARVHEWREGISAAAAGLDTPVETQTWFLSLRPYIGNDILVSGFVRGKQLGKLGVDALSAEVNQIERRWGLI
ncbi:hypothetical protein [Gordonia alkanivorans]|uniref:hypothetical protein n=1 Tax=Gordonia alkanivorans TaxID=84096 RepID=UPI002447525E|nr:hypothetical protein [Gordonia alkanivorans]MDH3021153.1 hypothetical protein [Gordonia alkanivorans]MDJ0010397.1 hypothetical protein [Gordonia alkanivorans]MDJ0099913.1 hypothetical protein [Gordonia alkanivorans]MDJ0496025.1 hypothetical protein [Gordonia alkanivorans]